MVSIPRAQREWKITTQVTHARTSKGRARTVVGRQALLRGALKSNSGYLGSIRTFFRLSRPNVNWVPPRTHNWNLSVNDVVSLIVIEMHYGPLMYTCWFNDNLVRIAFTYVSRKNKAPNKLRFAAEHSEIPCIDKSFQNSHDLKQSKVSIKNGRQDFLRAFRPIFVHTRTVSIINSSDSVNYTFFYNHHYGSYYSHRSMQGLLLRFTECLTASRKTAAKLAYPFSH